MKIKKSVRYFLIGNEVYLRDTDTYKDYLFNETVYDILQIISRTPDCSMDMLLSQLLEVYNVEHIDEFQDDIAQFVNELYKDRLLVDDDTSKAESSEHILDHIRELCDMQHRLYGICLEMTYRCNEKCIHCYIDDPKFEKELTLDDYKNIINQVAEMGCINVLLTGGEVSLHPHFIEVAEYAAGKGMLVDIYTNGYNISVQLLERMIALRPNSISFSFYGGNAAVHDAITGIPGSFERSLRTAMICKCAGIDTFIKSIGLQQNIDSLDELCRLGQLLDIPVEIAKLVLPSHTESKNLEHIHLKDPADFMKLLELEEKYKGKFPRLGRKKDTVFNCSAGRTAMAIDPYGNVNPCNAIPIQLGNVKTQSISQIWEASKQWVEEVQTKGSTVEHCLSCGYQQYCGICLGGMDISNSFALKTMDMCAIAKGTYQFLTERSGKNEERICSP